ncbi:MAG: alkaline phosphatase [Rhizobiales bacterium]|nr:alkaline phosphatase [Hyphomicrobiales bacterium]
MTYRWPTRLDVDAFATINRRRLLQGLGTSALVTATGGLFSGRVWANPVFPANPFALGVASGDPAPDGFVIWTKIAPRPLEHGSGMPKKTVEVDWMVGADPHLRQVVQQGKALARPELGHAVHVEVGDLEPARNYFYRFTIGDERSRLGRARTLPAPGSPIGQIRFGVAGCQRYEDGFFTAYRHLAQERFDFVFHYGDYIYEHRILRPGDRNLRVARVMPGEPDEIHTLDDYRHRYAVYKSDVDLQLAHASAPFLMSYDDHEVDNNWASDISEENVPRELFLLRRAAAFQAWYEHMPVRRALIPRGPDMLMYRRFAIGDLLIMNVLDTRHYRSDQACGDRVKPDCKEALDAARTMLGERQERWLTDSFKGASGRWTVLGQQVMMMRIDYDADPNVVGLNMDAWDGAPVARQRLLTAAEEAKLANLVVLTGDVHSHWAGEFKRSFGDENSQSVGVEFTGTSIASGGDGFDSNDWSTSVLAQNPHVKLFNSQRGYTRHVVTPERWQADFRVLDKVSTRGGKVSTRSSLVAESGKSVLMPL